MPPPPGCWRRPWRAGFWLAGRPANRHGHAEAERCHEGSFGGGDRAVSSIGGLCLGFGQPGSWSGSDTAAAARPQSLVERTSIAKSSFHLDQGWMRTSDNANL